MLHKTDFIPVYIDRINCSNADVEEGNVQRTIQISCLLLCKIQAYPLLLQLTGQVNSILLLSCRFSWKPVNDSIGTEKQLRKNTGAYDMFDSFPSISALQFVILVPCE